MGKKKQGKKGGKKIGRNATKGQRYRARVGRPRGAGVAGTKCGKRWTPRRG